MQKWLRLAKEFDFQWKKLPDRNIEYTLERVTELLGYTGLKKEFFKDKYCLDAGCGNGRWTWALMQMGAKVDSFDISPEAVEACKQVNSNAYLFDIMELKDNPAYDFVLCWGVLHHLEKPEEGFYKVVSQLKDYGVIHIMVYHRDEQKQYEYGRKMWASWTEQQRLDYCKQCVSNIGGSTHGWWDAFNPKYNWGFHEKEVKKWFEHVNLKKITLIKKYNINMIAQKILS